MYKRRKCKLWRSSSAFAWISLNATCSEQLLSSRKQMELYTKPVFPPCPTRQPHSYTMLYHFCACICKCVSIFTQVYVLCIKAQREQLWSHTLCSIWAGLVLHRQGGPLPRDSKCSIPATFELGKHYTERVWDNRWTEVKLGCSRGQWYTNAGIHHPAQHLHITQKLILSYF